MADRKHDLYVSALDATPVDFEFSGENYGETWETVHPDVDSWDLAKCRAYLDDQGKDFPGGLDPFDPDMPRQQAVDLLVRNGLYDYDDPDDAAGLAEMSDADARRILNEAIDDEMFDDPTDEECSLEAWRQAVRDAMSDDPDAFAPMMNYYYPLPHLPCSAEEAQEKVMDTACVVVLVNDEPVLALAGGGMDLSPDICRAYVALGYYPPMHFASNLPRLGTAYREITPELVSICLEGARIAEGFARRNVEDLERFAAQVEENRRQG